MARDKREMSQLFIRARQFRNKPLALNVKIAELILPVTRTEGSVGSTDKRLRSHWALEQRNVAQWAENFQTPLTLFRRFASSRRDNERKIRPWRLVVQSGSQGRNVLSRKRLVANECRSRALLNSG